MSEPLRFDQAKRIAAALCYIALAHLDHVTILPFSDTMGADIHPGSGKGSIVRVMDQLDALAAGGRTDLYASFKQFASRGRLHGLSVVISDFLDPAGYERALKLLGAAGHEIHAVHVTSRRDRHWEGLGEVRLVDKDTCETHDVDVTPALADGYEQAFDARAAALELFCGRYGMGYVRADAERPFEEIVLHAFRQGRFLA